MSLKSSNYNILLEGSEFSLLWNTISNKMIKLDNKDSAINYYNLKDDKKYLNKSNYINHYLQGFIVKDESNMRSKIKSSLLELKNDNTFALTITVTLGCNFGCNYCCQGTEKDFSSIDENSINRIIELYQYSKADDFDLTWYGGEPLLNFNKIYKATKKIKKRVKGNFSGSLLTNGFLLNKKTAKKLEEVNINYIQISIDGSKKNHNLTRELKNGSPTYDAITKNIDEINNDKSLNLEISIRINIFTSNCNIKEIIRDFVKAGASSWKNTVFYLSPIIEKVGNDDFRIEQYDRSKFAEIYREFLYLSDTFNLNAKLPGFSGGVCSATMKLGATISPTGEIYKCWDTITTKTEKVSDLKDDNEIILSSMSKNKWIDFDHTNNPKCAVCKLSPLCGGSCAINHSNSYEEHELFHTGCPSIKFLMKEYFIKNALNKGVLNEKEKIHFEDSKISLDQLRIYN